MSFMFLLLGFYAESLALSKNCEIYVTHRALDSTRFTFAAFLSFYF